MKGIWLGESDVLGCIYGEEYEIAGEDETLGMYGVYDETGKIDRIAYLYEKDGFKITEQ